MKDDDIDYMSVTIRVRIEMNYLFFPYTFKKREVNAGFEATRGRKKSIDKVWVSQKIKKNMQS